MLRNNWCILNRTDVHQPERIDDLRGLSHFGCLFRTFDEIENILVLLLLFRLYFNRGRLFYFFRRVVCFKCFKNRLELLLLRFGFDFCLGFFYLWLFNWSWFLLDDVGGEFGHDKKLRLSISLEIFKPSISLTIGKKNTVTRSSLVAKASSRILSLGFSSIVLKLCDKITSWWLFTIALTDPLAQLEGRFF